MLPHHSEILFNRRHLRPCNLEWTTSISVNCYMTLSAVISSACSLKTLVSSLLEGVLFMHRRLDTININTECYLSLSMVFSSYSLVHYLDGLQQRASERSASPDSQFNTGHCCRSRVRSIRERNRGSHIAPC